MAQDHRASKDMYYPCVSALQKLAVDDDVPSLDVPSNSVDFDPAPLGNPVHFVDHRAFDTSFGAEMETLAKIESMLAKAEDFVQQLYASRSVTRAIPMVKTMEDENRTELNTSTFETLRPVVAWLGELMDFQAICVKEFCSNVAQLAAAKGSKLVPEGLYTALIKMIDVLQKMDNLKDMKACLQNDFTRYKRAFGAIRSTIPDGQAIFDQSHALQMFLANPVHPKQLIFFNLRSELKKIDGHEEVLTEMLTQCTDFLERGIFVTPDDKYRLLRGLPHLLLLIDGDTTEGSYNVFKQKKLKLDDVKKLFKQYPILPMYGDMPIKPAVILTRAPHYDLATMGSMWGADSSDDKKVASTYQVTTHWKTMRQQFDNLASRLTVTVNEVQARMESGRLEKDPAAVALGASVAALVTECLDALREWSCHVQETIAWKMSNPASEEVLTVHQVSPEDRNLNSFNYERCVRYNYDMQERSVMVDATFMIKSLAAMVRRAEVTIAPLLRMHVHGTCQQLVQSVLLPSLHRCDKGKRPLLTTLLQLRTLGADWVGGVENKDDFKKYSSKDGRPKAATHPTRAVGPAPTQLHLMRTIVRALFDEGSEGRQSRGFFTKKDLEKDDVEALELFYSQSYRFPALLDLTGTVREIADLSDLWYREFYLDLSNSAQFPINASMPWILTKHVVSHQGSSVPLLASLPLLLDVYNDAAHRALYVLKQAHLYAEIEGEVNLVLDQLTFLISDEMYGHYKDMAAVLTMDAAYKERLNAIARSQVYALAKRRYEIPTAQRHLPLLGRAIDLRYLVTQQINTKLRADLDFVVKKFEASEIQGVVDYVQALRVVRGTHALLAKNLPSLDAFDDVLAEVTETVGPMSFRGRVVMHVLSSLVMDLFPNYTYNAYTNRFVKAPIPKELMKRPKMPTPSGAVGFGDLCGKPYDATLKLGSRFFGRPHAEAILEALGTVDLPLLLTQLQKNLETTILDSKAYVDGIKEGLPPIKLPKYMFRTGGCYSFFEAKLKPFLQYDDLKPEVFQIFREIGNMVAFTKELSDVLDRSTASQFMQAAPLMGAIPGGGQPDLENSPWQKIVNGFMASVAENPSQVAVPEILGTLKSNTARSQWLYGATGTSSSVATKSLATIDKLLTSSGIRDDWSGSAPSNGVLEVEATSEFYRLWSALLFLYCMRETKSAKDGGMDPVPDDSEFGHGFLLAGAMFIHLLGMRDRFELLDFSAHMLRVDAHERNSQSAATSAMGMVDAGLQADTDALLKAAKATKLINDQFFNFLEARFPTEAKRELITFHPPPSDAATADTSRADMLSVKEASSSTRRSSGVASPAMFGSSGMSGGSSNAEDDLDDDSMAGFEFRQSRALSASNPMAMMMAAKASAPPPAAAPPPPVPAPAPPVPAPAAPAPAPPVPPAAPVAPPAPPPAAAAAAVPPRPAAPPPPPAPTGGSPPPPRPAAPPPPPAPAGAATAPPPPRPAAPPPPAPAGAATAPPPPRPAAPPPPPAPAGGAPPPPRPAAPPPPPAPAGAATAPPPPRPAAPPPPAAAPRAPPPPPPPAGGAPPPPPPAAGRAPPPPPPAAGRAPPPPPPAGGAPPPPPPAAAPRAPPPPPPS